MVDFHIMMMGVGRYLESAKHNSRVGIGFYLSSHKKLAYDCEITNKFS